MIEHVPQINSESSIFGHIFDIRRPLNPIRIQKTLSGHVPYSSGVSQEDDGCKVVVQVLRAFNVPVRVSHQLKNKYVIQKAGEKVPTRMVKSIHILKKNI